MRSVDGNRGSVVGNRARGSPGPGNYGAQKAGHFWAGGGRPGNGNSGKYGEISRIGDQLEEAGGPKYAETWETLAKMRHPDQEDYLCA